MATNSVPASSAVIGRTAVLASPDLSFRQRVRESLTGLRWQVKEADGGAEALAHLDAQECEALILDSWLPDLEVADFIKEFQKLHPGVDLIAVDAPPSQTARSPRRNELLYALRRAQDTDEAGGAVRRAAAGAQNEVDCDERCAPAPDIKSAKVQRIDETVPVDRAGKWLADVGASQKTAGSSSKGLRGNLGHRLPEFVGTHPQMLEVCRRIRLVARRSTPVLIQGSTGTGKELVAQALHRLSPRAGQPFIVLNCAAIPESLLESELFGHTRGAFTGAIQQRTGLIQAAHGGTLFLDEIGEMPLPAQAKLLRFLECGELQRIGENEPVRVDVRVIAATHQPLQVLSKSGKFRADLFFRLSVFGIKTPALASHPDDIPLLAEHFLGRLGRDEPVKILSPEAMTKLKQYNWPGNVRELEHVIERAWILAEERAEIGAEEIELNEKEYESVL